MAQEILMNMRPFGTRIDDLEVDFDLVRPVAITEVLARCAGVECELLWDLPVGRRTELLLALAELSGKVDYEAGMNCPECGLEVEVVLTLDEFRSAVAPHREDAVIVGQSRYRLPTGRDQLEWLRHADDDEPVLAARIIESLCVGAAGAARWSPYPGLPVSLERGRDFGAARLAA
jgi:hypothetical protein